MSHRSGARLLHKLPSLGYYKSLTVRPYTPDTRPEYEVKDKTPLKGTATSPMGKDKAIEANAHNKQFCSN